MEVSAPLALVVGRLRCDPRSPKCALDIGQAGWVEAIWARLDSWVPLKVDVESCAEFDRVTELLAFDGIVGLQGI